MPTSKGDSQRTTADCSSDDNLYGDLVAPGCFRITLFPGSCCIDFEHVFADVADLDAVPSNWTPKYQSHNILVEIAVLQVGDVKTLGDQRLS